MRFRRLMPVALAGLSLESANLTVSLQGIAHAIEEFSVAGCRHPLCPP